MATKKPGRERTKNARPALSIVWFEVPPTIGKNAGDQNW
jgi:hypothetical protein